jgi:hypothetical protein
MTSSSKLLFENSLPNRKRGELRVASWNVNGLRSILKKGFLEWLKAGDFDVVMLQEVKARDISKCCGRRDHEAAAS